MLVCVRSNCVPRSSGWIGKSWVQANWFWLFFFCWWKLETNQLELWWMGIRLRFFFLHNLLCCEHGWWQWAKRYNKMYNARQLQWAMCDRWWRLVLTRLGCLDPATASHTHTWTMLSLNQSIRPICTRTYWIYESSIKLLETEISSAHTAKSTKTFDCVFCVQ